MPKKSDISEKDLKLLRENFDSQMSMLDRYGLNLFENRFVKGANKTARLSKKIDAHTQGKDHYWCGVLGGVVDYSVQARAHTAISTLTAESGPAGVAFANYLARPAISQGAQTIGNYAQWACNTTTNYLLAPSKSYQQSQAAARLAQTRSLSQSTNSFQSRFVGLSSTNGFNARPYSYPSFSFNQRGASGSQWLNRLSAERAVASAVSSEMKGFKPNMNYAFAQAQANLKLGMGYNLARSEFRSLAASTNLISSYNRFNTGAKLSDVSSFCRDIGGVAGEVATITDLIDSDAHAEADNYIFCFESDDLPFPTSLVNRIQHELKNAYFTHKTSPFFSLHFNNFGYLYPVLHPAFQESYVGLIISLLDYWMKGFLNGGIFDEEFLKIWHETKNCDETYLKDKMQDLKKYCERQGAGLSYTSLREFMNKQGVTEKKGDEKSPYQQPFMTSFRIIASLEDIWRHGNVLVPRPGFRIEYSIDLMPDYKNYIDSYLQEHGHYPEDYQQTRQCYELFAEEIKQKMPKLPFCRDFFKLLGVMNTFSYFYATLDQMGKEPDLPPLTSSEPVIVPKAFPPIPVRYFKTEDMEISLKEVLLSLQSSLGGEAPLNALFFESLNNPRRRVILPPALLNAIKNNIETIVKNRLLAQDLKEAAADLNQTAINNSVKLSVTMIISFLNYIQNNTLKELKTLERYFTKQAYMALARQPLPTQMQGVIEHLTTYRENVLQRWNENPALARTEIFDLLPENMEAFDEDLKQNVNVVGQIRDTFKQYEDENNTILPKLIKDITDDNEALKTNVIQLLTHISNQKKKAREEIATCQNIIAEASAANATHQNNITAYNNLITQLNAKIIEERNAYNNWYSKIPSNSIALNAALIANNTNVTNNNIAHFTASIQSSNNAITELRANIEHNTGVIADQQAGVAYYTSELQAVLTKAVNCFSEGFRVELETVFSTRLFDLNEDIAPYVEQLNQHFSRRVETKIEEQRIQIDAKIVFNNRCKTIAIYYLNLAFNHYNKILLNNLAQLNAIFPIFSKHDKFLSNTISKKYTYTTIGFTGEALEKETGDKFKIIGGCGVSLPNIETRAMPNGEAFSEAIAAAYGSSDHTIEEIVIDGRRYTTLRVCVSDKLSETLAFSNPQTTLCNVFSRVSETKEPLEITEYGLIEPVDDSGAFLVHYIASFLDLTHVRVIIEQHPEQLYKQDKLGFLPIHAAAKENRSDIVNYFIEKDAALLERPNLLHATPLMVAIEYGATDSVTALLAAGANANHLLPNGLFPLMLAVQNNFSDSAMLLLKHGNNIAINQKLDSHVTALHVAIEHKMRDVAIHLIELGAAFTILRKSDGQSAWHVAAALGELSLIQAMLAKGAALDAPLESLKTALHLAAEAGHVVLVDYLIKQGASVNAKTRDLETPLMLSIKAGQTYTAERLAQVTDINSTNQRRQTASLIALQCGQAGVADVLIERGENPLLEDEQNHSYLYYLVRNGEFHRFVNLVERDSLSLDGIVKNKALIETAAKYGHFSIVYYLLDAGYQTTKPAKLLEYAVMADEITYLRDQMPKEHSILITLAQRAAEFGSLRCLAYLLSQLTQEQVFNASLLCAAINHGNLLAVDMLLNKHGDMKRAIDKEGNTPLHLAVLNGQSKIIEAIVKAGADFHSVNLKHQTVFHIAYENNNASSFKKLLKLSQPSEWPAELWEKNRSGLNSKLKAVLSKYEKKLSHPVFANNNNPSMPAAVILDDRLQGAQGELLTDFIESGNFELALDFMSQPDVHVGEHKNLGELLRLVLENTIDYTTLLNNIDEVNTSDVSALNPKPLLNYLKSEGMDPRNFTGKRNPIYAILKSSENDQQACYRLSVFASVFPESLTILIQDKVAANKNCAQIALINRYFGFFNLCDSLCQSPNSQEIQQYSALHEAVLADNYEQTQALLKRYPVDCLNNEGHTPLMLAALSGNLKIVQLLVKKGALPDRRDREQLTVLHHAILGKSESVALYLLPLMRKRHHAAYKEVTPLLLAAEKGMLSVVSALCADGHAIKQVDILGRNALHLAALSGHVKVIEYLVRFGFPIDEIENPLSEKYAVRSARKTALHFAALKAHTEAVARLIELGADIQKTDSFGNGLCEFAIRSLDTSILQFVESLPLYHQPDRERTMLQESVRVDHPEVLSEIVLSHPSLNVLDKVGNTVLHIAAQNNSGNAIELLLQGNDIPLDLKNCFGNGAIHIAAKLGHVRIIEALINAGANINLLDNQGATALFLAAEAGMSGAVITLLSYDADFTIKNKQGMSASQVALFSNHTKIAARFILAGDESLQDSSMNLLPTVIQESIQNNMHALKNELTISKTSMSLMRFGFFSTDQEHTSPIHQDAAQQLSQ